MRSNVFRGINVSILLFSSANLVQPCYRFYSLSVCFQVFFDLGTGGVTIGWQKKCKCKSCTPCDCAALVQRNFYEATQRWVKFTSVFALFGLLKVRNDMKRVEIRLYNDKLLHGGTVISVDCWGLFPAGTSMVIIVQGWYTIEQSLVATWGQVKTAVFLGTEFTKSFWMTCF